MQREPGVPVLVRDHEQRAPGRVGGAGQVPARLDTSDRERVTPLVRRPHELLAPERRCHELRRLLVRRQERDLAAVHVAQIEVVVAAALPGAVGDDVQPIRRDRRHGDVAVEGEGPLLPALEIARHDVEVDAVPPVRRVRERPAGRMRRVVLVPLVDDERLVADVQLRAFVPTCVALDENPPVRQELPGHRLLVEADLPHPGHEEELRRSRKVRRDEQLLAVRRERERRRLPHLEQRAQLDYAATPANDGMTSSPYAFSVSC